MAAVAVIPVAFRLIDEQLMVWIPPASAGDSDQAASSPASLSTSPAPGASASRNGNGSIHHPPAAQVGGRLGASIPLGRLPAAEIGDNESNVDALNRLIAGFPFAQQVARVKHCAVFADPRRVEGRREIALVSWVLVRPPRSNGWAERTEESDELDLGLPEPEPVPTFAPSASVAVNPSTGRRLATRIPSPSRPLNGQLCAARPAPKPAVMACCSDCDRTGWHPVDRLPPLVADHAEIIAAADRNLSGEVLHDAMTRRVLPRHLLRSAVDHLVLQEDASHHPPALFGLLPDPFPLSAIRRFYERLLGTEIDRGNFRRKLVELRPTGMLKELPIFQRGVRHRAAQLFTFDAEAWERWAATDESE